MSEFATPAQLLELAAQLDLPRHAPHKKDAVEQRIVYWHVFRRKQDALDFAEHIMMPADERLVGGQDDDAIGPLWWVGVEVENLEKWGNRAAVHKLARSEPENPNNSML